MARKTANSATIVLPAPVGAATSTLLPVVERGARRALERVEVEAEPRRETRRVGVSGVALREIAYRSAGEGLITPPA